MSDNRYQSSAQDNCNYSLHSSYEHSFYEPSIASFHSAHGRKSIHSSASDREKQAHKSSVYTVTRKVNGKKKKINMFNTSTAINSYIVNAVTGFPYGNEGGLRYVIGSAQEKGLFKVRFLTHENNIPGITLYYNDPEQYERHLNCTVGNDVKNAFIERRMNFEARMRRLQTKEDAQYE